MIQFFSAKLPGGRRFRQGLSLLEVLIGIALLGGAVLVVLGLFPTAYSSLIQARDTTAATNLARQVLEKSRAAQFNSLTNITKAPVNITSDINGAQITTQFFYDLNFDNSAPTEYLYYEASVSVRWNSGSVPGSGTSHLIRLDTVIPNR